MSQVNVNKIVDASGGVLAPISSVMRNRIINGAMTIDQRNAGASFTPTTSATYSVDRWTTVLTQASKFSIQQNAGSVTPPAGFRSYLGVTSLSAYSVVSGDAFGIRQSIEGFNVADFMLGTASAVTFTLSFWVRSSLTGTFGGAFSNVSRSYPFTYVINSANTWEQKSVTIAGDTSGTWATNNTTGLSVIFGLGAGATYSGTAGSWTSSELYSATGAVSVVGTNGATFYITGVQLERGTQATSFEYRQYGQELALCQRYYQTSYPIGVAIQSVTNVTDGASFICINTSDSSNGGPLPVSMRATPTFATYSSNGGVGANSAREGGGGNVTGITLVGGTTNNLPRLSKTAGLGTQGAPFTAHWTASAEL